MKTLINVLLFCVLIVCYGYITYYSFTHPDKTDMRKFYDLWYCYAIVVASILVLVSINPTKH